jgi:lipid-A-disaccharide synthase
MAVNVPEASAMDTGAPVSAHRRIMIVAGEASGDLHGGELAARIMERDPSCELYGVAGERMRAVGVKPVVETEEIAGMGATELAGTIRPTLRAFARLRRMLKQERPNLLILIDFADFNMKLAWFAKRAGVPVLYYILPQVWAWRRWRIRTLARRADRIAVVFPFEADLYAHAGARVEFVGHPLLDRTVPNGSKAETLGRHGLPQRARLIAILPGSRRGEIRYLLRPMLEAARILAADHDLVPVMPLASTLKVADLEAAAGPQGLGGVRIIRDDAYSIIAASELALVASGTATLETALLGCPMVIAYKMSGLTYFLGSMLVRGVQFIGMPNILAGKKLAPELIQGQVTPVNLVRAAEPMLSEPLHGQIAADLRKVREKLGAPGAVDRVAAIALEMIA